MRMEREIDENKKLCIYTFIQYTYICYFMHISLSINKDNVKYKIFFNLINI